MIEQKLKNNLIQKVNKSFKVSVKAYVIFGTVKINKCAQKTNSCHLKYPNLIV